MRDKPRLVSGNGVRVSASGRRIWTSDVKAMIVAESYEPGARVGEVARRHGLASAQLTAWRRASRKHEATVDPVPDVSFADLLCEEPRAPIEVEASGVVVRLAHDAPSAQIAEVASALRRVK